MNISSKIEELRRKINLSESKKKTDYQESEEEKSKNAQYITTLKKDIESLKMTESSKPVLSSPVKGVVYKEKNSRVLAEWFDQWILDAEKQINLLKHVDRKNQDIILKLEEQRARFSFQYTPSDAEENLKKVEELENNLEKIQMKINEAEFVEKKYGAVIIVLGEEILQLQKETVLLDDDVLTTKLELHRLKSTAQSACKASRAIQSQLNQGNCQFQKQKILWEQSLKTFHQQVDNICLEDDARGKSLERQISANETFISCEESSSPTVEGLSRSYGRDMLEKFKLSAESGETIMLEFNEAGDQIGDTIAKLQEKIEILQEEKDNLQLVLKSSGATPAKTSPVYNVKQQVLEEKLREQEQRKMKAISLAEMYTKFLETIRAALRQLNTTIALGCKLNSAGSPSPDDTVELLAVCMERVEFLVEQSQNYDKDNALQIYEEAKFSENVEEAQLMLKPKSKHVKRSEEKLRPFSKFDEHESPDQEILTRATIKRQAKTLIDYHAKIHSKGSRHSTHKS